MSTILSTHTKTDPDELMAMILLEEIYHRPFLNSESPDLYSEDETIGCEVTRAYPPEYERYNGKLLSDLLSDERKGIVRDIIPTISLNANISKAMARIQERVVDKMHKLYVYKNYPMKCLYVKTLIWSFDFELHTLPNMFDSLREQIISKCQESYGSEYKEYHVLFIECADMFIVWDWINNSLTLRSDIFDRYKECCPMAFHLIDNEMNNGISAVNNTPFKEISKLLNKGE